LVAIRPMAGTEARPTEYNKIRNSKFEIRNYFPMPHALPVLSLSKDALCLLKSHINRHHPYHFNMLYVSGSSEPVRL